MPREEQIRERARQLWEKAGCPTGRDDEFWHQAKAEMEADEKDPVPGKDPIPDPPPPKGGFRNR